MPPPGQARTPGRAGTAPPRAARSAPAPTRLRHRTDIDGLRAIAILPVLAFHAFPRIAGGGFVGVDVFFVISGYLITAIILSDLREGRFGFPGFYARRARRIFPSLSIVLAASITAGWFILLPGPYEALGKHAAAGAGFVANLLSWREAGYFDAASATRPLLHLWSLGVEEQFYIVWPLLLYGVRRRPALRLWIMPALAIGSFVLNARLASADAPSAFYSPLTRFWELLLGGMLADATLVRGWRAGSRRDSEPDAPTRWSLRHGTSPPIADILGVLGFGMIAAAVFAIDRSKAFPGWWALLPSVGTVLVIAAGPSAWPNRRLLSNRPMVWIGLISFQLYLWHWPILVFLHGLEGGELSTAMRVIAIAASFPLAWLTYALIDKPIRNGRHARAKTIAACCTLAALGFAGLAVFAGDGLPSRFPLAIRDLSAFRYDYAGAYREGTCFLRPEQDATQFRACTDSRAPATARSVYLWGDSHAAHLYPGLEAAARGHFRLTQLTASACPPFPGIEMDGRPHCADINAHVMERIVEERPDEVILAARWDLYDWRRRLVATIAGLQAAGVRRIFVVGPVPVWPDSLPASVYRHLGRDAFHGVPQRMQAALEPRTAALDHEMADVIAGGPAKYVSAMRILCNDDGCLVRTGPGVDSLTAWDDTHLTASGSEFLVSHFPAAAIGAER